MFVFCMFSVRRYLLCDYGTDLKVVDASLTEEKEARKNAYLERYRRTQRQESCVR